MAQKNAPGTTTRRRPQQAAEPALPTLSQVSVPPAPQPAVTPAVTPTSTPPRPPAREPSPSLDADGLMDLINMEASDFARMLTGELHVSRKRVRPGDAVRGRVVRLGDKHVFVDLGGKSEAAMDLLEVKNAEGHITVSVGDEIDAVVVSLADGIPQLARRLSGSGARDELELARESGLPVEGRVTERNSGGFVVDLGGARGFCPASQIDLLGGPDPDEHIGKTYSFRVTEIKGRDVVLTRRAILEEERRKLAEATRARLSAGQVVEVTVRQVKPNGVVVDLGGIEGFISRKELSWDSEAEVADQAVVGQRLSAKVTGLDAGRVSLSVRDAAPQSKRSERGGGGLGTFGDLMRLASKK